MTPTVTVLIVTYNGMKHLDTCFTSLFAQTYDNFQVLVVDSHSQDGTVEYIKKYYPQVEVLAQNENVGYRRGNSIGMQVARSQYVVLVNQDVELERDWLLAMVDAMEDHLQWGLATPRIMLFDQRQVINTIGNTFHFTGMYGLRGAGDSIDEHNTVEELGTVSGCSFIIRQAVLEELDGGFSEDFDRFPSGYHASFEDFDLAWRARLMGYKIGYVPNSVMYHKHQSNPMSPSRFCDYEWGRYLVVLRNYSISSLILLSPMLFVLEVAMWIYAFSKGRDWVIAKTDLMRWLLSHRTELTKMRQAVQVKRRVTDWMIIQRASATLNITHLTQRIFGANRLFNGLSVIYFHLIFCPSVFLFSQIKYIFSQDILNNMLGRTDEA